MVKILGFYFRKSFHRSIFYRILRTFCMIFGVSFFQKCHSVAFSQLRFLYRLKEHVTMRK